MLGRWRRWAAIVCLLYAAAGSALGAMPTPRLGSAPSFNLARFADLRIVDQSSGATIVRVPGLAEEARTPVTVVPGNAVALDWSHPRAVREVDVRFGGAAPLPQEITLEWWQAAWPNYGEGGWNKVDDPFTGRWTPARLVSVPITNRNELRLRFQPLEATEAGGPGPGPGPVSRYTYRLRLSCVRPVSLVHLEAFSQAARRRARLRFEWGLKTTVPGAWAPRFEARNGWVLDVAPAGRNAAVVELDYADTPERPSNDRGLVVFRSGEYRSFGVFVDDVLREGGLFVRDVGVFVSDAAKPRTYATWPGPAAGAWRGGTVTEQVALLPEATLARAQGALPAKPPTYLLLGVPDLRQRVALLPQGEIAWYADSLRGPGPEGVLRPWRWPELLYQFGAGPHPAMGPERDQPTRRSLEAGWLPVVSHTWTNADIAYTETCVVVPLRHDLVSFHSQNGSETVVAVVRFTLRNLASDPRTAVLWVEPNHPAPCHLGIEGALVLDTPSDGRERTGLAPVRWRCNTFGQGSLDLAVLVPSAPGSYNPALRRSSAARPAARYQVALGPGEAHGIDFVFPGVELLDPDDLAALKALTFERAHAAAVNYWQQRLARGMTYQVPDPELNDFFKANLWHVLISTELDPVNGLHELEAATRQYGNRLDETALVARSLEMRGEHSAAAALLEPFLLCQSAKPLPGRFRTRDGVLYAAYPSDPDPYTGEGSSLDQGAGLRAVAEHYLWTGDRDYLLGRAAQLAQGCNWVSSERQGTKFLLPDGSRPLEYGLLPAGRIGAGQESLCYYSANASAYLGMSTVAAALARVAPGADAAGPGGVEAHAYRRTAERLAADAQAFGADLRASVAAAVATSPVVRLRDGTYVPYVPFRPYALTAGAAGWIREVLEGPLPLVTSGVYDPRHPFADWIIDNLEDNLFLEPATGYALADPPRDFFDRGGFTLEPSRLDLALVYLARDQTRNCLRAFYNAFAASLYPDTRCFAAWLPAPGQGAGPLYKTADECNFVQWMRDLLVWERGEDLELGLGVPRAWMADGQRVKLGHAATYFGALDLELVSHSAAGRIEATVQLTPRRNPQAVHLRLRFPEDRPIRQALVNGRPAPVDLARQTINLPLATTRWQVEARF